MEELDLKFNIFTTEKNKTNNMLDFLVFDLRDVDLGIIILALQTAASPNLFQTIKEIVRDAIDNFAAQAQPLTAADNLEKLFNKINNAVKNKINRAEYGKIQSAFVYIKNNEVHFSLHNDFKIILIRKNRLFDIVKMTYGLPPRDYEKLFNRLYSGEIKAGDRLLITSSESWECLDTNKLPEICNKLSLKSAVEFIKNYLPEIGPYKLGGILLTAEIATPKEQTRYKTNNNLTPSESIRELINTEESTTLWLAPTPWRRFKKLPQYYKRLKAKINSKKIFSKRNTNKNVMGVFKKIITILFSLLFKIIKYIYTLSFSLFKLTFKHKNKGIPPYPNKKPISQPKRYTERINKNNFFKKLESYPQNFIYNINRFFRSFSHLPKTTKILFWSVIIIIIAFIFSLIMVQKNNQQKQVVNNFTESVNEIKELHTQANQATIFKDFSRARSLLIEANALINQLPTNNEKNEKIKKQLLEENSKQLNKANRLTIIPLPLELVNLSNIFKPSPDTIINFNGKLISTNSNTITLIDPENASVQIIELPSDIKKIEHILYENDNNLLIMHDNSKITRFNIDTSEAQNINNTIPIQRKDFPSVTLFNNRLYRLDPENNQIWRHLKKSGVFQNKQAWLTVPNDLHNSLNLAIDGYIYVLDRKKGIMQFSRGARTDWKFEDIEPSILSSTKIKTNENSDYLLILDPPNQRLLIYNKDGSFLQQFTSPVFNDLKDFTYIEKNKKFTAFLLNGNKIYVIQFSL